MRRAWESRRASSSAKRRARPSIPLRTVLCPPRCARAAPLVSRDESVSAGGPVRVAGRRLARTNLRCADRVGCGVPAADLRGAERAVRAIAASVPDVRRLPGRDASGACRLTNGHTARLQRAARPVRTISAADLRGSDRVVRVVAAAGDAARTADRGGTGRTAAGLDGRLDGDGAELRRTGRTVARVAAADLQRAERARRAVRPARDAARAAGAAGSVRRRQTARRSQGETPDLGRAGRVLARVSAASLNRSERRIGEVRACAVDVVRSADGRAGAERGRVDPDDRRDRHRADLGRAERVGRRVAAVRARADRPAERERRNRIDGCEHVRLHADRSRLEQEIRRVVREVVRQLRCDVRTRLRRPEQEHDVLLTGQADQHERALVCLRARALLDIGLIDLCLPERAARRVAASDLKGHDRSLCTVRTGAGDRRRRGCVRVGDAAVGMHGRRPVYG